MNQNQLEFEINIFEEGIDDDSLDRLTIRLQHELEDLGVDSVSRSPGTTVINGAKGDPFTIGALTLVTVPAILPQILEFFQNWLIERRKIVVEAPNGAKIEFTPDKKYSKDQILSLVKELNKIS